MKHTFSHALITGGSAGIGLALCQLLTNMNVKVVSADRSIYPKTISQNANFSHHQLDVTNENFVKEICIAHSKPFDLVIHCAAISAVGSFEKIPLNAIKSVTTINLLSPMCITRDLLQNNAITSDATHIFISSLSYFTGYPGASGYAASKDGLTAFARCIRSQIEPSGGRVVTVFPGPTKTEHAERYSPENLNDSSRMSPQKVALKIFNDAQKGKRYVIPGIYNLLFSIVGKLMPRSSTKLMAKWLLSKLNKDNVILLDVSIDQLSSVSKK